MTEAATNISGVEIPVSVLVRSFEDSGVLMEVRFWHPSEELEAVWIISEVAIAVREALGRAGIDIAFPQVVVHGPHAGDDESEPDRDRIDGETSA